MAGDAETDPLYQLNRRKVREIIINYSNPNQEPTLNVDEKNSSLTNISRERLAQRDKEQKESLVKWAEFLQKYEPRLKDSFPRVRQKKRFVELVYHGIPEAFRIKFWVCLLGINDLTVDHATQYDLIKEKSKRYARHEDVFQIDKDVQRTFRDRAEFKKDFSQRQCMLFNVLMAYSYYNNTLGYCQGMHQCAGLLLLYVPDEKSAFWGLHNLMVDPRYALHGMFLDCFPKYIRLRDDFETVLRKKNKSLFNHLEECQTVTDTYLMLWYFTVFQADFPLNLSLRIWDIFLLEGDAMFLPMAYTLITFREKELKKEECPKACITNFKNTLQYEESTIIEAFKRNFRSMMQSSKRPLKAQPPLGEIPNEFGTLLDRTDVKSNGFDDPEIEVTEEVKEKETRALIKSAEGVGFVRNEKDRLSFVAYTGSEESSPSDIPTSFSLCEPLKPRAPLTNLENHKPFDHDGLSQTASNTFGETKIDQCRDDSQQTATSRNKLLSPDHPNSQLVSNEIIEQDSVSDVTPRKVKKDSKSLHGGGDAAALVNNGMPIKSVRKVKQEGAIAKLPVMLTEQQERRKSSTPTNRSSRNSSQNSRFSDKAKEDLDGGLTSNDESLGGGSVNFEPSTSLRKHNRSQPESPLSPGSGPENDYNMHNTSIRSVKVMQMRSANSTGYLTKASSSRLASPHSSNEIMAPSEQSSIMYGSTRRGFLYGTSSNRPTSRGSTRTSLSPIALPDAMISPNGTTGKYNPRYATAVSPDGSYYLNPHATGSIGSGSRLSTRTNQQYLQSPPRSFLYTQGVAEKLGPPRNRTLVNRNSWSSDINYRTSSTSSSAKGARGRISASHRSPEPANISRFAETRDPFFIAQLQDGQKLETEFSVNGPISTVTRAVTPPKTSYVTVKRDGSSSNRLRAPSEASAVVPNGDSKSSSGSKKSTKKQNGKDKSNSDKKSSTKLHQSSANEKKSKNQKPTTVSVDL